MEDSSSLVNGSIDSQGLSFRRQSGTGERRWATNVRTDGAR